jgi:hypothetical protein
MFRLGLTGLLMTMTVAANALAQEAEFCPSGAACAGEGCDVEGADESACITFEEARDLAARPGSGVYAVSTRVEPALGGAVNATPANTNAICKYETCYVKGDGKVSLAGYGHQTVFFGWTGCAEGEEPHFVLGPVTASTECVAHFGPGLIVINASITGRADGQVQIAGSCSGNEHCTFLNGGSVTLSAPASDARYRFVGWSGCACSTEPVITLDNVRQQPAACVARYESVVPAP